MLRNYFLINVLIVIMLGFLGFKFYKVTAYSMHIPTEADVAEGQKPKDPGIKFTSKVPDKKSFQIISSKDLFRPSRTASVTAVRTTAMKGPLNSPKLFATMILGSDSIAIIEDPNTKKTKGYHINDLVAGLRILEILVDRVILLSGNEKIEIKLRDDKGIKSLRPKPLTKRNINQNARKRPAPIRRTRPPRIPNNNK